MTLSRIHYAKPSITELEVSYASDATRYGWGEKCYDYIHKFRDLLKAYLDVEYVVPTSSCTGGLHMALAALDVGAGDEVIVPDITWIASVSPIKYLGAEPVFVDVMEDNWCINPDSIRKSITEKTKAIIVVHLYGNLCDMNEIMKIGKEYNIPIIEDAAEALGSSYNGKMAGSIGDVSVFSFHGTKTITTGEGGALIVKSKVLYEKILTLDNHGRNPLATKQFWCDEIGYKYKMSNLDAAIGVAQMERVTELVNRKREIFSEYKSILGDISGIRLNPEENGNINSYWMATVVFDKSINFNREKLLNEMKKANIDARVFFYPVSMMPPFKDYPENIVSYGLYSRGINLPSYHDITSNEIKRVCDVIINYMGKIECKAIVDG